MWQFLATSIVSPFSVTPQMAACGEKVVHSEFGEGVIVSVDKTILTIAFPHPYGIKKIMKGHKSIRKV